MLRATRIDLRRVQADLERIAEFGFDAETGAVCRPGFSNADLAARRWLRDHFEANGLVATIDAVGNVVGRLGDPDAPAVVIGSHLDSVPAAGKLDGILGVVAGLECVRVIRERGVELAHPIEVIATSEEEGRFGGMLGAQALTGALDRGWFEAARDADGVRLVDAMRAQGFDPERAFDVARAPGSIRAFLELHIEQGPVLETSGLRIGVVDRISGIFNWQVTMYGQAAHSGTTPMNLRRDAFAGLAAFANTIPEVIDAVGTDRTRVTIGSVTLEPNHPHTVPGAATFTIVGRDTDEAVMRALADRCRVGLAHASREHRLEHEIREMSWLAPRVCDDAVVKRFVEVCAARDIPHCVMPSGAGHDTQFFTEVAPAGLIFIPSREGISHSPVEWSDPADLELGCDVLLEAVLAWAT